MKTISLILKIVSAIILIFSWIFVIVNFKNLPETVPIHYDFNGKPDGFGSKNTNWFLLFIQTSMCLMMFYLSGKPNSVGVNIPKNLKENKAYGEFVVSCILFLVMSLFGVINYESVLNGLGKTSGLSSLTNYLLGLILVFMIGMMIWSWLLSKRQKTES